MESAIRSPVYQEREHKAEFKTYQFIATAVEQPVSLRLEIDCVNDMEASLVALRLVSREHAVEVWRDGALIYHAAAIGHAERSAETHTATQAEVCNDTVDVTACPVAMLH